MTVLRYDLDRVVALRGRAAESLTALESVRSGDPAAWAAMNAVRRAAATLGERWLPLLDRIVASEAMVGWSSASSGLVPIGRVLGEWARRLLDDADPDDVERLLAEMRVIGDDVPSLRAFFIALGADGTAALLLRLGTIGDDHDAEIAIELAVSLRAGLATAELDGDFAAALVDGFVDRLDDNDLNPAAAMSFLAHDVAYPTDFLVGLTRRVIERELAAADPHDGFLIWPLPPSFGPPSILYRDLFDDDQPTDAFQLASDPLYAVLDLLAGDPVAARAVLTDDALAEYVLGQRNLELDGMRSLAAAAEAAAAGPDVVADADPELLRDAAVVASAFVNHLASRGEDVVWFRYASSEVSDSAATILGRHMPAVHFGVLHEVAMDTPRGGVVPMVDGAHGAAYELPGAQFDPAALDLVSALAVDSAAGVAIVRTALDLHQMNQAAATAGLLASGVEEPGDVLEEAVADAARLEAHFIEHAGHRAEERGRSKDVTTSFWIDLATFSLGEANTASMKVPIVSELLEPAGVVAKQLLAAHEVDAERAAEQNAEAAADQLAYVWYRQLYRAGVITPELPPEAVSGGELVTWQAFQELSDTDRAIVRSRMEETTGARGVNIDGGRLRDVIKLQQLPIYEDLE